MTTHAHDKTLVRLDALPQQGSRLTVDRSYPGRIEGVSLITTGPAAGHGFEIDVTTIDQVTEYAEGLRGRWTHGDLSADGLGRHLGKWENVRPEPFQLCRACNVEVQELTCPRCKQEALLEWRTVGDFAFDRSAYKLRPDGLDVPAPVYLMDRAQEDPRSLGISVVARFEFEDDAAFEDEEPVRLARVASRGDLLRGDWVADPAANPVGLHAGTDTPSELTEGAVQALDRIVARVGAEQAKTRALAFLARYFGDSFREEVHAEAALRESEEPGTLRARVDALQQELASLKGQVQVRHEPRFTDEERRERIETYLDNLRRKATALHAPIPAADLDEVRGLLLAGHFQTATALAKAYLGRSRAAAQSRFRRGGTHSLAQGPGHPSEDSVSAQRRLVKARGYQAELSEDGSEIEAISPLKGAGK